MSGETPRRGDDGVPARAESSRWLAWSGGGTAVAGAEDGEDLGVAVRLADEGVQPLLDSGVAVGRKRRAGSGGVVRSLAEFDARAEQCPVRAAAPVRHADAAGVDDQAAIRESDERH